MSLEGIIIGLLAIVIGLAWAFYGLKLFAILLPIWAFFFGLIAGAQWSADIFGHGFFSTVLSWGIGLVFGLVLAAISYFWYYAAVTIAVGALGYLLGAGLVAVFLADAGILQFIAGLVVFTVAGVDKRDAFARVRAGDDLPAAQVEAARVVWLADTAAAGG